MLNAYLVTKVKNIVYIEYHSTNLSCRAAGYFFAVFVPGVEPRTGTAGEGVAGDRYDYADRRNAHRTGFPARGVVDVVPRAALENEERSRKTLQFACRRT